MGEAMRFDRPHERAYGSSLAKCCSQRALWQQVQCMRWGSVLQAERLLREVEAEQGARR